MGALFRDGDGWAVFVADGSRARKRKLQVTARNANEAQVTSGLAAGERVIVYPSDALKDGARLEFRSAPRGG